MTMRLVLEMSNCLVLLMNMRVNKIIMLSKQLRPGETIQFCELGFPLAPGFAFESFI
jgi:hypothetical protein